MDERVKLQKMREIYYRIENPARVVERIVIARHKDPA
jgi:hypothetical protein